MHIRNSARAIIINNKGQILLFRFQFEDKIFWITPGGGLESNESFEEGLVRELYEETSIKFDAVGTWVYTRNLHITRQTNQFISHERYYYLPVDDINISLAGMTTDEQQTLKDHKWWNIAEIQQPDQEFAPPNLGQLAQQLLMGNIPHTPLLID